MNKEEKMKMVGYFEGRISVLKDNISKNTNLLRIAESEKKAWEDAIKNKLHINN